MELRISPKDSWTDVLDRVLDKGIVIEAWAQISMAGVTCSVDGRATASFVLSSAEIYEGYGEHTQKRELLGHLFPYWRKDLWTK